MTLGLLQLFLGRQDFRLLGEKKSAVRVRLRVKHRRLEKVFFLSTENDNKTIRAKIKIHFGALQAPVATQLLK